MQAARYPTVIVYVMDTARSENPVTFMSNMLYACSILYKTKLPFLVAMNKVCLLVAYSYYAILECYLNVVVTQLLGWLCLRLPVGSDPEDRSC